VKKAHGDGYMSIALGPSLDNIQDELQLFTRMKTLRKRLQPGCKDLFARLFFLLGTDLILLLFGLATQREENAHWKTAL